MQNKTKIKTICLISIVTLETQKITTALEEGDIQTLVLLTL